MPYSCQYSPGEGETCKIWTASETTIYCPVHKTFIAQIDDFWKEVNDAIDIAHRKLKRDEDIEC